MFSKDNSRLEEVQGEGLESGKDARLQEVPGEGLESSNSRCRFQEVPAVGLEFYVSKVKVREAPPDGLDLHDANEMDHNDGCKGDPGERAAIPKEDGVFEVIPCSYCQGGPCLGSL